MDDVQSGEKKKTEKDGESREKRNNKIVRDEGRRKQFERKRENVRKG